MGRVSRRLGTKSSAVLPVRQGSNGERVRFGSWRGRPYGKTAANRGTYRVGTDLKRARRD